MNVGTEIFVSSVQTTLHDLVYLLKRSPNIQKQRCGWLQLENWEQIISLLVLWLTPISKYMYPNPHTHSNTYTFLYWAALNLPTPTYQNKYWEMNFLCLWHSWNNVKLFKLSFWTVLTWKVKMFCFRGTAVENFNSKLKFLVYFYSNLAWIHKQSKLSQNISDFLMHLFDIKHILFTFT